MSDIITKVHKNSDGTISFQTSQDVEDILNQNEFEYKNNLNRSTKDTFGRKVASIPMNMVNAWCKEWGITFRELMQDPVYKARMMSRLRDPDFKKLRTDSGKI